MGCPEESCFVNFSSRFLLPVLCLCLAGFALPALAQPAPLFVLNSLDASVSVIDPVKWTETKRLATGKEQIGRAHV